MADTEYSTTTRLPREAIWDYVHEIDNWAAYLPGYQGHEKESDDDSVWTLKGDLGSLQRTLEIRVHVTEWAGPERVRFELKGLNEPVQGHGEFHIEAFPEAGSAAPAPPTVRKGPLMRLIEAVIRFFYRRRLGEAERAADADAGPGEGMSRLTFRLTLNPAGPMAPMIDAMMKPAMVVAAEALANRIVGHLEKERDAAISRPAAAANPASARDRQGKP